MEYIYALYMYIHMLFVVHDTKSHARVQVRLVELAGSEKQVLLPETRELGRNPTQSSRTPCAPSIVPTPLIKPMQHLMQEYCLGPQRPHKHKDPTFWFQGNSIQGESSCG